MAGFHATRFPNHSLSVNLRRAPLFLVLLVCALKQTAGNSSERWFKGNTHTHTLWSDGNDFPETAADWYKSKGYDFLVLSDHNVLQRGERWKDVSKHERENKVVSKHRERWGESGLKIRTRDGKIQARLKTLEEIRRQFEEPGAFIMIEGFELTASAGRIEKKREFPVHSNAINVDRLFVPQAKGSVHEMLEHQAHLLHSHTVGKREEVFWHLNHPNFHYAVTAEIMAAAPDIDGVEIFNASTGCKSLGDEHVPSVERIWDIANTLRIKKHKLPPIFGCATDDTHNYHTPQEHYHSDKELKNAPGLAWVMVRSDSLDKDSISSAMRQGDFYSSTGITLRRLEYDEERRELSLEVDPRPDRNYQIRFIGSSIDVSLDHTIPKPFRDWKRVMRPMSGIYADERLGGVLKTVDGTKASYRLNGSELFVRAVVSCDAPNLPLIDAGPIPRMAWTQPVGWEKSLGGEK